MVLHALAAAFSAGELVISVSTWRTRRAPVSHVAASVLMAVAMLDMGVLGHSLVRPVGWAAALVGAAIAIAAHDRFTRSASTAATTREGMQLSLALIAMAMIPFAVGPGHTPVPSAHAHGDGGLVLVLLLVSVFVALIASSVPPRTPGAPGNSRLASAGRACMLTSLGTMTVSAVFA